MNIGDQVELTEEAPHVPGEYVNKTGMVLDFWRATFAVVEFEPQESEAENIFLIHRNLLKLCN